MRGSLLLWILLGLLAATLGALLFVGDDSQIFGLEKDQFAQFGYLAVLALALTSAFTFRRISASRTIRDMAIWVALVLVLVLGYSLKDDLAPLLSRVQAALVPGTPAILSDDRVQISRAQSGDFQVKSKVNDADVTFIFDTGASAVVLTYADAKRAGFLPERLQFSVTVDTANGQTTATPVRIGRIQIGPIIRENVRGLIANQGDLKTSLLGMTFMNELSAFSVRGDTLELQN